MSAANPVSPKVVAAAAGAGAGAIVGTFVLWVLGASAWGQGWTADQVDNALAAVPTPVTALVLLGITIGSAAIPGYRTTDPLRLPTVTQDAVSAVAAAEGSNVATRSDLAQFGDVEVERGVQPRPEERGLPPLS